MESGEQLLPDSPFEDNNGWAGEPEWVGNLNFTLTNGPWTGFWGVRYVGDTSNVEPFEAGNPNKPYTYLNKPVIYILDTPEVFYHSLSLGYDWEEMGVQARFGIRNVLDTKPPITSANAGYFRQGNSVIESQYDLFGRTFFLNLSKTF
jgi:iron complex outermembrane receptor protein